MAISVNDLHKHLIEWGYDASLEPEEKKPPGKLYLTYDMTVKPEDVGMTSYEVKHKIMIDWVEAQPDTISTTVITLMGRVGTEYAMQDRFEIGEPKITRGDGVQYRGNNEIMFRATGTLYYIMLPVYWVQWVTIDL